MGIDSGRLIRKFVAHEQGGIGIVEVGSCTKTISTLEL